MGFLARLFKGKTESKNLDVRKQPTPLKQPALNPWPTTSLDKTLELPGGFDRVLYVYDDAPFSNAQRGDVIKIEFFPGEARLCNKKTGSEVDTRADQATCLLHNGKPVGVIFDDKEDVKLAYNKGIRIFATATVGARLREHGNVRALTLHLPSGRRTTRQLIELHEVNSRIPSNAQRIQFNEWDEDDFRDISHKPRWIFENVTLSFLPVPKGSSAKPHIQASADGLKLFRLTARNSAYREVVTAISSNDSFIVLAERRQPREGLVGYQITLICW
ncbi:hypothetical protein HMPREF2656_00170 [Corynebacterium sp. HMSC034B08]|uniref:hypothetical protein n=1 Tax=Corynebacterium TaxID=1716 RepID=UPI0008A8B978|nr:MULTISPECIES: hypothetical protein [Corynebacterium]OHO30405.1 hypothetical protein HMPREF2656_00170 [Corynebacterium sp. HMSC034B08]PLA28943.1 hypothetical protein CYJ45_01445 [Corynebacterium coyleae]